MHFINPFKGLRPSEKKASTVTVPSTDHLSEEAIVNHKKNYPLSYLNIFNPDCQKSDSKKEIDVKAKKQFELMKNNSTLIKDDVQSFYIYKISLKNHTQTGIIGTAKLSAYDDLHIRGHEEIYLERAQERFDQMLNLNAQIGSIYVIYPDNKEMSELTNKETTAKPRYSFKALDDCQHELWIVDDPSTCLLYTSDAADE